MNNAMEMAVLTGPLFTELREYIDKRGVTALAMLSAGVSGTAVTTADMPNVTNVAAVLLQGKELGVLPVLEVLTPDQMDSRITAGESAYIGSHLTMGVSAEGDEVIIIDPDNPSISLWICHADTCSLLLLTTFAQLRELVELVVLADVQSAGIRAVH